MYAEGRGVVAGKETGPPGRGWGDGYTGNFWGPLGVGQKAEW